MGKRQNDPVMDLDNKKAQSVKDPDFTFEKVPLAA